jgi:ADP-ribose pyrophosphatase YjhB (NUDIX family)
MSKSPKISLDIVIKRRGKVLFGLLTEKWSGKSKGVYGLPGREIHFGEKIADAVKRNIKEEIGCKLKKYKIIAVTENFAFKNHYIGIGIEARIEGKAKNMRPQDWQGWEWFSTNALPKNLFPSAKALLETNRKNVPNK